MQYENNAPTDELLDLVNDQDEVIGEVWRNIANRNPELIHREIGVILYTTDGKLLMQQRAATKKVGPNYWTMAAEGHIPRGDTALAAAHMELTEELGFDTKIEYWDKDLVHQEHETHFTHWFIGKYENQPLRLQESEVQGTRFLAESEFDEFVANNLVHEYTRHRCRLFWQEYLPKYGNL
jgi:isopentenyl-diphosphate Delta-isomerase